MPATPFAAVIESPVGRLGIRTSRGTVSAIEFVRCGLVTAGNPVARRASRQLTNYFDDGSAHFNLPLAVSGTAFQQAVWRLLRTLPAGESRTYGELAAHLGSGARAVGNACRANPLPIIVPCHRVVAMAGLGGYAGADSGRWLARKRWLLCHEGAI